MKISVGESQNLVVEEVYNSMLLRTSEGNEMTVCMRDDTFEITLHPKGKERTDWIVDMLNCRIVRDKVVFGVNLSDSCTGSCNS